MRLVQTYPLADIIKVQKALLRIKSGELCCVSASTILKKLQSFQNAYKTWWNNNRDLSGFFQFYFFAYFLSR